MTTDHAELGRAALKLKNHPKITSYAEFIHISTQSPDAEPAVSMGTAERPAQCIGGDA